MTMNTLNLTRNIGLTVIFCLIFTFGTFAQETVPTPSPTVKTAGEVEKSATEIRDETSEKAEKNQAANKVEVKIETASRIESESSSTYETVKSDETRKADGDGKNRQENLSEEEAAIIPYYNNYLSEYHLGPEDVISVEVFNQPEYSKAGITIPPTARIGYPLIPGGVFVGGKTLQQLEAEIAKKLDEYIIDPKVTVTLEKVGSARYSILGDVAQPGIRLMTRRLSISEALTEAGGVLPTGSLSKITILRQSAGGGYTQIPVDLKAIRLGKAENVYLTVGDQVVVPGNKIKTVNNVLSIIGKLSAVRLLFGSPF